NWSAWNQTSARRSCKRGPRAFPRPNLRAKWRRCSIRRFPTSACRFLADSRAAPPYSRIMEQRYQPAPVYPSHNWGSTQRFLPAVILIVIGAAFLLDNLHLFPDFEVWSLWPVAFIVLGAFKL